MAVFPFFGKLCIEKRLTNGSRHFARLGEVYKNKHTISFLRELPV